MQVPRLLRRDDVAVQVEPQLLVRDGEAVELQAASILPGTFEGDGAVPSGEEPRARVLWRTDVAGAVEAEGAGAAAVALPGEVALRCGEVAQAKSKDAGPAGAGPAADTPPIAPQM